MNNYEKEITMIKVFILNLLKDGKTVTEESFVKSIEKRIKKYNIEDEYELEKMLLWFERASINSIQFTTPKK